MHAVQAWSHRLATAVVVVFSAEHLLATGLNFGPEQLVQAGGTTLTVTGYSVPSLADWNDDGRQDLLVGEGGGGSPGKLRVYLNDGTSTSPHFSSFSYAKSNGNDLSVNSNVCLGIFPRLVRWGDQNHKALLVGQATGQVSLYTNTGTDSAPTFDGGTFLRVGQPGFKADINVGGRATPSFVDWNSDGRKDLVVGSSDSRLHIFLNEGSDAVPDFRSETFAKLNGADLYVPSTRSSPVVMDFDGDGKKDVLTGNMDGQILLYSNTGLDTTPSFSGYTAVTAGGVVIDLAGSLRSRPSICDWNSDGRPDLLVGYGDRAVRLYMGLPEPATLSLLLCGLLLLNTRR